MLSTENAMAGKLAGLLQPGQLPGPRACIAEPGGSYTGTQAAREVGRCARLLRESGLSAGDRVLAIVDHDAWGIFFMAAASTLGLRLLMPYNLQAAAVGEWRAIASHAMPDAIVYLRGDAAAAALSGCGPRIISLPRPAGPSADEPAGIGHPEPVAGFLVLFTSGSTGAPKAISVSEAAICERVASVSAKLAFGPGSRVFMSGLLNNTTGVIFSFGAFLHQATLIIPEGRDPASWPGQVARSGATHIMLRPAALRHFLAAAARDRADLSSLQVLAYGASALPQAVLREGRELITCDWVQGYGLSETYGPFCWLDEAAHQAGRYRTRDYCVGRPDGTMEVRVAPLDGHPAGVGEILVRGSALMDGYYDAAADRVQPRGEWLRTGDLGHWGPGGDLLLKGRVNGTLMSENGHRIYPAEVEAVLCDVPGVDDAIVVGIGTGDALVELPSAVLCGPLGSRAPRDVKDVVVAHLSRALSREKWPDLLYATPRPFPRGDNDKVMRAVVAKQVTRDRLIDLRAWQPPHQPNDRENPCDTTHPTR
jgi:acyl-coenzyme A synthetase/AMP-(fatty) acid ligase